jgi:hypothetical protein
MPLEPEKEFQMARSTSLATNLAAPRALAYPQNRPARPLAKSPAKSPVESPAVARDQAPTKRGLFARLFDAVAEARMRQAEREIARYFAGGVKFTDEAERDIERRFLSQPPR